MWDLGTLGPDWVGLAYLGPALISRASDYPRAWRLALDDKRNHALPRGQIELRDHHDCNRDHVALGRDAAGADCHLNSKLSL